MTPERNNFKELFREEETRFEAKQSREDSIGPGLWRTLGFFRLMGDVVELFIPRVFELIVMVLGGDARAMHDGQAHAKPPSLGPDDDPRDIKPRGPGDDDPVRGPEII